MRHYLTYQHNVQKFFREHSDKYDGVVIPLSIATSFPGGTYGFVRALCSRHPDVQYSIDPRNAIFQKAWNRSKVRAPHKKMVAVLGEPYSSVALSRDLMPTDLADDATLRENVESCLEFQKCFRTRSEEQRKLRKYQKLLGVDTLSPLKEPQHLIPPYYQFSSLSDPWYTVSLRSVQASNGYREGIPVRPVLHFRAWEGIRDWGPCFAALGDAGIEELWYYPNYLREHHAGEGELSAYRKAVKDAVSNQLQPYSLFGGYFAVLMSYFGLAGFGNGIGYGEWRDSGYHRGGTAVTRVYLLKLHRYVDAPTAQSLIDRDPDYFGNDSEIVAGYVDAGKSVVDMSLEETLDHFMKCRKQELEFVQTRPLDDAISELKETGSRLTAIGPLEEKKFGAPLARWQEAIS